LDEQIFFFLSQTRRKRGKEARKRKELNVTFREVGKRKKGRIAKKRTKHEDLPTTLFLVEGKEGGGVVDEMEKR